MARRPNIDTGQLEKANQLMSDIVSKFDTLARMDEIPVLALLPRQLDDIDEQLRGVTKAVNTIVSKGGQKKWAEFTKAIKDNRNEAKKLSENMKFLQKHYNKTHEELVKTNVEYHRQTQKLEALDAELKEHLSVRKALVKLGAQEGMRFLDWFGGSVVSMTFSTVFAGMKLLSVGIEKVYDLQEKWTHAIGTFRKTIGPATLDSREFERSAADMHFELYELGLGFEAAHQEMANFVRGFGFANKEANRWAKDTIRFGVVTGAGTEAVAELSRTLKLMGVEFEQQQGAMTDIIGAANTAGVSVSQFTRDIVGAKESVAEFGSTGRKMFLGAAAWAAKLGVSVKSLQNIIKLTDTFQSTAEAAAKMNTVFGTSINSMDLMLEQDPAKRFNMLRDSLIGAGKDMKNLSRLEKKLISDTLGMSMEETNAFLKSGESYTKFIQDKQTADEEAAIATRNMNKLMAKATTTLFEWGALAEKVLTKYVRPFAEAFLKGLIPGFNGFGDAANKVGDIVEGTFKNISNTLKGLGLEKHLTGLGGSLRQALGDFFTPENISAVAKGMGNLFSEVSRLLGVIGTWLAGPGGAALTKLITFIADNWDTIAGAWLGGKTGGAIGGVFGPKGQIIGSALGALVGGAGTEAAISGPQRRWDEQVQNLMEGTTLGDGSGMSREQAEAFVTKSQGPRPRRFGGPTAAHTPYIVGEEGPEVMVPGSGAVIPNAGSGGIVATATAPIVLKVQLDSREIQRIPFNTSFPINVSVVGA